MDLKAKWQNIVATEGQEEEGPVMRFADNLIKIKF